MYLNETIERNFCLDLRSVFVVVSHFIVVFDLLFEVFSPRDEVLVISGDEKCRVSDHIGSDSDVSVFDVLDGSGQRTAKHSRLTHIDR